MKTSLSPVNKPAQDFTCVLQELRQPDSRAVSWEDFDSIRGEYETGEVRRDEIKASNRLKMDRRSVRHRLLMRRIRNRNRAAGLTAHGGRQQRIGRPESVLIEFGSRQLTFADWSKVTGIALTTLRDRILRGGWTVEKALTVKPKMKGNQMPKEMMIKITSDEVMELKMLRDELSRGLEPANRSTTSKGVGTDQLRQLERRVSTINAILKRAATA
jgi:hypothetical protein